MRKESRTMHDVAPAIGLYSPMVQLVQSKLYGIVPVAHCKYDNDNDDELI